MKESIKFFVFLSLWLGSFIIFFALPILISFVLAFTDFDGLNFPEFIGLDNWLQILRDPLLFTSLKVTFSFAWWNLLLGTCIAIGIAILLSQKTLFTNVYRFCLYLPTMVPIVASSVVWIWVFTHFSSVNTLASTKLALSSLIIMSFWSLGNPILIYLAGIQNIPEALYEAAYIDGASKFQCLVHITLPMLMPTIIFNVLIGLIQTFQYFVPAFIMTHGGPQSSTTFYSLYIYQKAFDDFDFGYASALSWFLFLLILVLTIISSNFRKLLS